MTVVASEDYRGHRVKVRAIRDNRWRTEVYDIVRVPLLGWEKEVKITQRITLSSKSLTRMDEEDRERTLQRAIQNGKEKVDELIGLNDLAVE